jgi:mannose-6-phosphate isomerase-like protein (cupin superfamily)
MIRIPHRIIKTPENKEMLEETDWSVSTIIESSEERQIRHVKFFSTLEKIGSPEMYHIKTKKTWYILEGQFQYTWRDINTGGYSFSKLGPGDLIEHEPGQIHTIKLEGEFGSYIESSNGDLSADTFIVKK